MHIVELLRAILVFSELNLLLLVSFTIIKKCRKIIKLNLLKWFDWKTIFLLYIEYTHTWQQSNALLYRNRNYALQKIHSWLYRPLRIRISSASISLMLPLIYTTTTKYWETRACEICGHYIDKDNKIFSHFLFLVHWKSEKPNSVIQITNERNIYYQKKKNMKRSWYIRERIFHSFFTYEYYNLIWNTKVKQKWTGPKICFYIHGHEHTFLEAREKT